MFLGSKKKKSRDVDVAVSLCCILNMLDPVAIYICAASPT